MGLGADAELIWGIPVLRYDEEGETTPFWDDERDWWREFDGDLEIRQYGHYEDPDNTRGILTSKRVKPLMADCWDPTNVEPGELATSINNDKLYSKSGDEARAHGLDLSFYSQASWWLVASFG